MIRQAPDRTFFLCRTNNGAVNERKAEMNENDANVEPTDFWYIDSKYHIHCEEYIEYHKDAMDWDLDNEIARKYYVNIFRCDERIIGEKHL